MTETGIKRIVKYKDLYDLSSEQTLYMVLKHCDILYALPPREIIELMDLKLLDEEGEFTENLETIKKTTSSELIVDKPKFESKLTREIYNYLNRRICYKSPITGNPIAKNPDSIKKNKDKRLKEYDDKCFKLMKKEKNFVGVYNIFLSLFPTMAPETYGNPDNTKWVTFFGTTYSGMNLRKKTITNSNSFLKIVRKRDSGIFLYGLYLFILNGIVGDKTFIASQKNFLAEVDVWYEMAELKIDEATTVESLFKGKRASSKGTKGGVTL